MRITQKLPAELEEVLPDFVFAFEGTGSEAEGMYYKCETTAQLNHEFGDLLHKIQDLEVSTDKWLRGIGQLGFATLALHQLVI